MVVDPDEEPQRSCTKDTDIGPQPSSSQDPNIEPQLSASKHPNIGPQPSTSKDPNIGPQPSTSKDPNIGRQPSTSKENNRLPKGWSKREKYDLLQCIKIMGSHDIEKIHINIPTKTPDEIKVAIDYYKTKALKSRFVHNKGTKGGRPRTEVNLKPSLPLSHWAKFLTDNINYDELQTELPTVLRTIADFEIRPEICTEYIDFRKAYHMLANAMEGKDLEDDKCINTLIAKSMLETVMTSKVFIQNTTVKQILENIQIKDEKDMKNFQRPITNQELAIVQHLTEQRNYNPFNISEEFLRPSND